MRRGTLNAYTYVQGGMVSSLRRKLINTLKYHGLFQHNFKRHATNSEKRFFFSNRNRTTTETFKIRFSLGWVVFL